MDLWHLFVKLNILKHICSPQSGDKKSLQEELEYLEYMSCKWEFALKLTTIQGINVISLTHKPIFRYPLLWNGAKRDFSGFHIRIVSNQASATT